MHLQPLFEDYKYCPYEKGKSIADELFEQGLYYQEGQI